MALHLNLLHEEISELRQRKRDPLKIGIQALVGIGVLMLLFYMFKAYQTLEIKNRLSAVQRDWAKVEPDVTAAQKRTAELTAIVGTTKIIDTFVEGRFLWAPVLQSVSRCVAPNAQLTSLSGSVNDDGKVVVLTVDGMAAGREPRAAAEELRQLLSEQLSARYTDVKVEFKTLEDLDNLVNVAGTNMATARFIIASTFKTDSPSPDKLASAQPLK